MYRADSTEILAGLGGRSIIGRTTATLVAIIFAFLLSAVGTASAQPLLTPTQNPLAGSQVFGAKGCPQCHRLSGAGTKAVPDFSVVPRPRSFSDLAAAMWNHLPRGLEQMQQAASARSRLTPQATSDLIAFLFTLDYFDPPGNAENGKQLFSEKKCIVCHQVGGTGGVVGPNLDVLTQHGSAIFVAAAMWNHGPRMAEAMRASRIERPTLKDSDLLDLIAYVRSASPAPREVPLYILPGRADDGKRLFVKKRCIECHSIGREGGRAGPNLVERRFHLSLMQFAVAMWNKAPAMMKAMKTQGLSVPQLQADEMAELVAYLQAIEYFAAQGDPRKGREVARNKGCVSCHSIEGAGAKLAGDLADVSGLDSVAVVISTLWNHSFVMQDRAEFQKVPWPRFHPDEMADLVALLEALGRARAMSARPSRVWDAARESNAP